MTPRTALAHRLRWGVCGVALVQLGGCKGCQKPVDDPPASAQQGAWVTVTAGEYRMGSPLGERCRDEDEGPVAVQLSRGMVVGRYEVTQAEFKQALGHDPSFHAGCPKCPVEGVTHHEALAYCNHLSATEALAKCYSCSGVGDALRCSAVAEPQSCSGYRLPTEAEWELVARAGSGSATPGGAILSCMAGDEVASSIGWYKSNSEGLTHPVGSRAPNAWGVYDMSGNAYEWTADWYAPTLAGGKDPTGPDSGTLRVLRGGSWYHNAHHLRSAKRMGVPPERRLSYAGFRCVRTLDDATTVGD